ncbi:hypothetical protein ABT269_18545 [Streptomyces viridosporus]|uniref:hypothetical protein n=1 Tax=Streptomyces viridosporus TaxID=67581 RepID=UPI003328DAD9
MTEIARPTGLRAGATDVVTESYAFACMRCGYGWEQTYEIQHHTDAEGQDFVVCVADGRIIPSPLSRPTCRICDGHLVRIMRAGRVASARDAAHRERLVPPAGPVEAPWDAEGTVPAEERRPGDRRHRHLSDLLHLFHREDHRGASREDYRGTGREDHRETGRESHREVRREG